MTGPTHKLSTGITNEASSGRTFTDRTPAFWLVIFLVAHLPVGILMKQHSWLATLHACVTIVTGMWWAIRRDRKFVFFTSSYMLGSEILWRMSGAQIPYETSKYSMGLMFLVVMARTPNFRFPWYCVVYLLLLFPGAFITLLSFPLDISKQFLSFNLSGPALLALSVAFFSQFRFRYQDLLVSLPLVIAPILSLAGVCFSATFGVEDIEFGASANFEASGGFGPNQVSSALGFGIVAAFFCVTESRMNSKLRLLLFCSIPFFIAQSMLTFSRTGLYLAAFSCSLSAAYLIQSPEARYRLLLVFVLILGLGYFWLFPRLDAFTNGALASRFSNTDPTGRDKVVELDFMIWRDNPVFGIGAGAGKQERSRRGKRVAAHTEFTRLLSEHGLFGFGALLMLGYIAWSNFHGAGSARERGMVVAMLGVCFIFMSTTGMRLALPAFAFGLTGCRFAVEPARSLRSNARAWKYNQVGPSIHWRKRFAR